MEPTCHPPLLPPFSFLISCFLLATPTQRRAEWASSPALLPLRLHSSFLIFQPMNSDELHQDAIGIDPGACSSWPRQWRHWSRAHAVVAQFLEHDDEGIINWRKDCIPRAIGHLVAGTSTRHGPCLFCVRCWSA